MIARVQYERDKGYVVRRFRVVNVPNGADPASTDGLPKVGDRFSPESPRLVVVHTSAFRVMHGGLENAGVWDVAVYYSEVPAAEWEKEGKPVEVLGPLADSRVGPTKMLSVNDTGKPQFDVTCMPLPIKQKKFDFEVKPHQVKAAMNRYVQLMEGLSPEVKKAVENYPAFQAEAMENEGSPPTSEPDQEKKVNFREFL